MYKITETLAIRVVQMLQERYVNLMRRPFYTPLAASLYAFECVCRVTKSANELLLTSRIGAQKFKVGDRVFGASQGGYATHIVAPEASLRPVPQGWDFADAAGLMVTAPTVRQCISSSIQ